MPSAFFAGLSAVHSRRSITTFADAFFFFAGATSYSSTVKPRESK